MINLTKRTAIRVVALTVAVLVAVSVTAYKKSSEAKTYKLQVQNNYSRCLSELNASVNNISLMLQKAQYLSSAAVMSDIAAELIGEAQLAKTALSQLPSGEGEFSGMTKFLSQVGNYALSVSKTLMKEGEISSQQKESLKDLSSSADKISNIIENSNVSLNNIEYWASEVEKEISGAVPEESLSDAFSQLEDDLTDSATLIYDGPYSDHILNKDPEMIKDALEVTKEHALTVAASASSVEESKLTLSGEEDGDIAVFHFSGENCDVTISRYGGYPVYMRKTESGEGSVLEYSQVLQKAKRYLSSVWGDSFIETYYYTDEGVCVVSFAYVAGETVCYTDLVKVGVSMSSGEIVLLESSGYIYNHRKRAFASAEYTAEQAMEKVDKSLTINEFTVVLIPKTGNEIRCYEFLCSNAEGGQVLVYINVSTLEQEEILIVLSSDGGTLTK